MRNTKIIFIFSLINLIVVFVAVLYLQTIGKNKTTPVNNSVTTQPSTQDTNCIITVDNVRYDFTQFRNLHSGGDVFQCGTDMSTIFHNQHPLRFLEKMAKYKI